MSYILDALKKSEQERGRGTTPGIQTVHSSSLNYAAENKSYWPYVLIVAVILNLIAVIYFMSERNTQTDVSRTPTATENTVTNKNTTANISRTVSTAPAITTNKPPAAPTVSSDDLTAKEPVASTVVTTAADTAAITSPSAASDTALQQETEKASKVVTQKQSQRAVIDYHDLPATTRQSLPAIIISAHVYSSNPSQRSIVINNNFMEEGEYFIDDLILHEITRDGAIFDYQNTLFYYSVVSGWQ